MSVYLEKFLLIFVLFLATPEIQGRTSDLQVKTSCGVLIGKQSHGTSQFLGIPYAQPPVGALRFKPPVACSHTASKITVNAKSHGPACMQNAFLHFYGNPIQAQSEDCLTLNVYVPDTDSSSSSRSKSSEKGELAVMVFIHGGAYLVGGSEQFPGHILANQGNVIVVTMNYRLGVFGFLTSGDEKIPGNMGLMDQHLALKWVQDNIGHFGGDKDKVTVFGQSAGGMSINLHTVSPMSTGLFQRAISQSGAVYNQIFKDRAYWNKTGAFEGLAMSLGCQPDLSKAQYVSCLQSVSAESIANLNNIMYEPLVDGDGGYIPKQPKDLWNEGRAQDVSFMTGVMRDEGLSIFDIGMPGMNKDAALANGVHIQNATLVVMITLAKQFPDTTAIGSPFPKSVFSQQQIGMILQHYFTNRDDPENNLRSVLDFFRDIFFFSPSMSAIDQMSSEGTSKDNYLYYFTHSDPEDQSTPSLIPVGPGHSDDLQYLFEACGEEESSRCILQRSIIHAWTTFAKYGEPLYLDTEGGEHEWLPFDPQNGQYLEIETNIGAHSMHNHLLPSAKAFWEDMLNSV